MHFNVLNRNVHYWASAAIAIPLFIIICSGAVLQLKKHWSWVQPPEQRGSVTQPAIELSHILESLKREPSMNVRGWEDVNRLDVRPGKGIVKAWLKSAGKRRSISGPARSGRSGSGDPTGSSRFMTDRSSVTA